MCIAVDWSPKEATLNFEDTAKIISFSKCFVSCFSCLAQGSAASLPYH